MLEYLLLGCPDKQSKISHQIINFAIRMSLKTILYIRIPNRQNWSDFLRIILQGSLHIILIRLFLYCGPIDLFELLKTEFSSETANTNLKYFVLFRQTSKAHKQNEIANTILLIKFGLKINQN